MFNLLNLYFNSNQGLVYNKEEMGYNINLYGFYEIGFVSNFFKLYIWIKLWVMYTSPVALVMKLDKS